MVVNKACVCVCVCSVHVWSGAGLRKREIAFVKMHISKQQNTGFRKDARATRDGITGLAHSRSDKAP